MNPTDVYIRHKECGLIEAIALHRKTVHYNNISEFRDLYRLFIQKYLLETYLTAMVKDGVISTASVWNK